MSDILLSYQVRATATEIDNLARKIAIEQSVEIPDTLITAQIEARYVGKIKSIQALKPEL